MRTVLALSQQPALHTQLQRAAETGSFSLQEVHTLPDLRTRAGQEQFDILITDHTAMIAADGQELEDFVSRSPQTTVILVAPNASPDAIVEAMRRGATDVLHGEFDAHDLLVRFDKLLEIRRLRNEIDFHRRQQPVIYHFEDIIGESPQMRQVFETMRRVAPTDASVLVTGETGTGKELVAGAIHFNSQRRRAGFIKVNCAALPDTLLESELFGHEKGAFTGAHKQRVGRFEQADGGTMLLDEIGDMGGALQAKILRLLQEHEFERLGGTQTIHADVRIIAATNRNLPSLIEEGSFREDLYYRLNVVNIQLAPLRERREDIAPLIHAFVDKFSRQLSGTVRGLTPEAMDAMMQYGWPGNIRQLQNVIERAVIMCDGEYLAPEHLALDTSAPQQAGGVLFDLPDEGISLEEVERRLIVRALEKSGGVQKRAAALLRISPRVINYKIKKHGIKAK